MDPFSLGNSLFRRGQIIIAVVPFDRIPRRAPGVERLRRRLLLNRGEFNGIASLLISGETEIIKDGTFQQHSPRPLLPGGMVANKSRGLP
jgi:hypothetical protein